VYIYIIYRLYWYKLYIIIYVPIYIMSIRSHYIMLTFFGNREYQSMLKTVKKNTRNTTGGIPIGTYNTSYTYCTIRVNNMYFMCVCHRREQCVFYRIALQCGRHILYIIHAPVSRYIPVLYLPIYIYILNCAN